MSENRVMHEVPECRKDSAGEPWGLSVPGSATVLIPFSHWKCSAEQEIFCIASAFLSGTKVWGVSTQIFSGSLWVLLSSILKLGTRVKIPAGEAFHLTMKSAAPVSVFLLLSVPETHFPCVSPCLAPSLHLDC